MRDPLRNRSVVAESCTSPTPRFLSAVRALPAISCDWRSDGDTMAAVTSAL